MTFTKLLTINSAAAIVAIVAWVLNVEQLYWMAGVLFLLPHGSRWFARLELKDVDVKRRTPGAGHQGETVSVSLQVRSQSWLPKLHLAVKDDLPPALLAESASALPIHVLPHGEDTATYQVTLLRRGVHAISSARIHGSDPLGLCDTSRAVQVASQIVVYPRVVDLPEWLQPRDLGGGYAPLDVSQRQGEGSSFWGLREYRPGDSPRYIHWRTAARLGRLTVIEWEAETSRSLVLGVETAADCEVPLPGRADQATSLDVAAGLAASLAAFFLNTEQSLRLVVPGVTFTSLSVQSGAGAMSGILEPLARMRKVEEGSLAVSLRDLAPQLDLGTTVCWITAVPNPETISAMQFLAAAGMRSVLYAIEIPGSGLMETWENTLSRIEQLPVSVIRVSVDDEFVRRLLG